MHFSAGALEGMRERMLSLGLRSMTIVMGHGSSFHSVSVIFDTSEVLIRRCSAVIFLVEMVITMDWE